MVTDSKRPLNAIPRATVVARILDGEHLVIYKGLVLRIPHSWLDAHPGGNLSILHYVGRDATDEVEVYHPDDVLQAIKCYAIGTVDEAELPWNPFIPPVEVGWVRKRVKATEGSKPEGGKASKYVWFKEADAMRAPADSTDPLCPPSQILLVQKNTLLPECDTPSLETLIAPPSTLSLQVQVEHSVAFKDLHQRIIDAGLYKCRYISGYGPEIVRYSMFAFASYWFYQKQWFLSSAFFLGLFWWQLVFFAHDLGHVGVTHCWEIDRLISILIADFIGGLSIGWWVDNHNIHHLVTNHPSHDPDIEHLPFLAISPVFFQSLWSSYYKRTMHFDAFAKVFITIQHYLFYVIMLLARFNLYGLSYTFLVKKAFDTRRTKGGRWAWGLEIVGIIFFWCWFGRVLVGCGDWKTALGYLFVSHASTSILHVQIVLSHFSMSTADLGPTESFPARQMRTTSDVICRPDLGWIHGGLHLQVTHHLFPRLPRHNLGEASKLVKEFAKERGLVYAEFGFVDGNMEMLGVLQGVAEQLKIMKRVAKLEVQAAVDKKLAATDTKTE
ncbi:fatty acid/sphingolipid desaturase [Fistulina hepatica ATCC 64428]|uniref:Delta 8-(E)-sphingolipid desaturase n=1 Tax=Fistulina hepatica ATCC 64428 TaxID=1128425 RepID=A0A0D7AGV2_9AGAR|nr:fatty acid/sphingolipid desaturase [Fistulina hepatica ATCC 64428]